MNNKPSAPPQAGTPPQHIVALAVEVSGWSPCRSKRGVVVFSDGNVIGHGYNYKPRGFDCDGSEACKATCRREAIHAEQQALLSAGSRAHAAEMLHVKTVDGKLVPSGGPSCVECSKLVQAAGVAWVWLYHEDGWRRYTGEEFHRLSLASGAAPAEPLICASRLGDACDCGGADTVFHAPDGFRVAPVEPLTDPYHVEVDGGGRERCQAGMTWTVIGPDGYALGTSYENKDDADDIAGLLNGAHEYAAAQHATQQAAIRDLVEAYREKRNVDGLNGRPWDGTRHWHAEQRISELEAKLK